MTFYIFRWVSLAVFLRRNFKPSYRLFFGWIVFFSVIGRFAVRGVQRANSGSLYRSTETSLYISASTISGRSETRVYFSLLS